MVALAIGVSQNAWGSPAQDKALLKAAYSLEIDKVRDALKAGANPNSVEDLRPFLTPLTSTSMGVSYQNNKPHPKSHRMRIDIIKMLFANGARLGSHDYSILKFPIRRGELPLISLLLANGASPSREILGYTPTQYALVSNQKSAYDLLVTKGGIPVNRQTAAQLTLIGASGHFGDIDRLRSTLKAGARINGIDPSGMTALVSSVAQGIQYPQRFEIIRRLLDHGANPNLSSINNSTISNIPLHIFIFWNQDVMNLKSDNQYDIEVRGLAEEAMKLLFKAGAKVSGVDSMGRTPLHWAAKSDNYRAAQILISEGSKVMPRDKAGKTPLDYAETGRMIKLLKANGARE